MQAYPSDTQEPSIEGYDGQTNQDSTALDLGGPDLTSQPSDDYFANQNLDGQLVDGEPEIKKRLSDDYNQLDEPILDTLMRDLSGIYKKIKIIALPLSSYDIYKVVLRGWDLWGPLILCTFLAFNLHNSESNHYHRGPQFADIFVLVWFGSCIVSLNYRLLSISSVNNQQNLMANLKTADPMLEEPTFNRNSSNKGDTVPEKGETAHSTVQITQYETPFQSLISPPSIFQLMCVFGYCLVAPCFGLVLLKLFSFTRLFFERIIVGLLFGFAWPTFCSIRILIRYQHPDKRALAIYPIGLFYFVLSCMIILNH